MLSSVGGVSTRFAWSCAAFFAMSACSERSPCPEDDGLPIVDIRYALDNCNHRPTAAVSVPPRIPRSVELVASAEKSADVDGDALAHRWSVISPPGRAAMLEEIDGGTSVRVVHDGPGTYEIALVTFDGQLESIPTSELVRVTNALPVARAGADFRVEVGAIVSLDGNTSYDGDGDVLAYDWTFASKPAQSNAVLADWTGPTPSFTADVEGLFHVALFVSDGADESAVDRVWIASGDVNLPPNSEAGSNLVVEQGRPAILDGSASNDADGQPLTFSWVVRSAPDGAVHRIADAAAAQTQFVGQTIGRYTIELTVHDGVDASAPDTLQVEVVRGSPEGPDILAGLLDLPVTNMVMDHVRDLLVVAIHPSDADLGNRIGVIDPHDGTMLWSVDVGSDPVELAIADDGSKIYVGLRGAPRVVRVDVESRMVDLQFEMGPGEWRDVLYPGDMVVVPGSPQTLVVSTRIPGVSPDFGGVVVYDDGVPRPTRTRGHTGARMVEALDSTRFYGYNNSSTEFGFRGLTLSEDGIEEDWVVGDLFSGFATDFRIIGQRAYTTRGGIVEPTSPTVLGTVQGTGPVAATRDGSRVWIADKPFSADYSTLRAYDGSTFREIRSFGLFGEVVRGWGPYLEPVQIDRFGSTGFVLRMSSDAWFDDGSNSRVFLLNIAELVQ